MRLLLPIFFALALTAQTRPRVIVTSGIGGGDADDFQSMVYLLLHSDVLDVEGLISSPYGGGSADQIRQVIDLYEEDYPNLRTHSAAFPSPARLRAAVKQGARSDPGPTGVSTPTEGSEWMIQCAHRSDDRPLHVLVWGGLEDLAQALHDAPEILPKLRVYFIGGPNKMWSVNAYNYLEELHPQLWIIEANSTYWGWFTGGEQQGPFGNTQFVSTQAAGHGALGRFFASQLNGVLRMGDAASVGSLLSGDPDNPERPGWGGKFVPVWDQRKTRFYRLTSDADVVERFGVAEFYLPLPAGMTARHRASVLLDGRVPVAVQNTGRSLLFRFSPPEARVWSYTIRSDFPALDGLGGSFTAVAPSAQRMLRPAAAHANWWTDDLDPYNAEGVHCGAKHVNRFRRQYLDDFATRLRGCQAPRPY
ncbi:MAG: DUF1593 domain-containing protein [Acidobacteria bacterium]|nr:DUF1593 domain-containing protein [Acidobacteriota bacterium]